MRAVPTMDLDLKQGFYCGRLWLVLDLQGSMYDWSGCAVPCCLWVQHDRSASVRNMQMDAGRVLSGIIFVALSIGSFVVSYRQFKRRGYLFNNAYL